MFLKKKRVKRDLKAEALKDAERRISEFKSNLPDLDPEKAQKKFSHIAIKAFSRIYGLHYEATYEEVASDIQRKRIPDETKEKVKGFCQKMVNLEYGKHQQKGKKLSDLVDEFEEILKHDHLEEHEEKKNWFKAPKKAALPDPPAPDMPPPPETPVSTTTNKLFGKKLALPHMELPRVEMPHLGMHEAISSIFSKKPKELEILPSFEEAASSLPDLPLMEIAEPEKAAAEGLPEFDIKEKDKLDKDIERLLATIDTDKKKIAEEVGKLKAEGDLIDEQRKKIKAMAEETPKEDARQARIRELQKDIESKKEELKAKEADLQAREKELNSKIIEIESLRGEIDGLNAKVSNDSEKLRLREQELKQKEKVLDEIRLEVEQQNVKVMKEVDKFKLELKEKQENFLELQKFFNQRENKLSHEESHFLEQKRRHVKYLEISIVKHRELLEKDLLVTERRLLETINEYERIIKEADAYQGKFRELEKDKLFLEKELHTKMEFFDKAEKEMLSKDPQLTEMALAITAKEEKLKEREDMILRLEQEVKLARSMQRKKKEELEIKELDLRHMESRLTNMKLRQEARKLSIHDREHSVKRQGETFDRIHKTIESSIRRRKSMLHHAETTLVQKEKYSHARNRKSEKLIEGLEFMGEELYGVDYDISPGEELHIREMSVTELPHISVDIGTPEALEIYRLLNISKIALSHGQFDDAKKMYGKINDLYERLAAREQADVYDKILNVYRPKEQAHVLPDQTGMAEIDSLISRFQENVESKNIEESTKVYTEIQKIYYSMDEEMKAKYYDQIMSLYSKAQQA